MTFSIVAYDKDNKEIGFAIASCCWNAGLVCMITKKGAITHQAKGNTKFHPIFFDKLAEKLTLEEILEHFKTIDEQIESRQIGMVSFEEDTALSFTGKHCSFWAGHKIGKNYACQGNILVSSLVIDSMAHAVETTTGNLTEKLYAALQAGDNAGGDARGKQAARLCVIRINAEATNQVDTIIDFNIEDHEEPVKEIGRLLAIQNNYRQLNVMEKEFQQAKTDEDRSTILVKAQEFLEDKKEPRYLDIWATLGSINYSLGYIDRAVYCFKTILTISPTMVEAFKIDAKLYGLPDDVLKSVLE